MEVLHFRARRTVRPPDWKQICQQRVKTASASLRCNPYVLQEVYIRQNSRSPRKLRPLPRLTPSHPTNATKALPAPPATVKVSVAPRRKPRTIDPVAHLRSALFQTRIEHTSATRKYSSAAERNRSTRLIDRDTSLVALSCQGGVGVV